MEYILIIAQESDITCDEVMHWLRYIGDAKIVRINDTDRISMVDITITETRKTRFVIEINQTIRIDSEDVIAYWYRRGGLAYSSIGINSSTMREPGALDLFKSLNQYYNQEWEHITDYIHHLLATNGVKSINSFFDLKCNKLINLEVAKQIGLKIPDGIVSNDVERIRAFLNQYHKVICKPVRSPGSGFENEIIKVAYSQQTNLFKHEHLDRFKSGIFQPTHFQQYIEKRFEVRAFYLSGHFYSMAIFSQANHLTQIDFRNYDDNMPNRTVPFKLSNDIEDKLMRLMIKLNYASGSIDLIFDGREYYFLEVNTVGQFKWVSRNCNYYIEKEIAKQILN